MKPSSQIIFAVLFTALLAIQVLPVAAEPARAPERVLWDKRPINIHIQRGQERIIHFPDEVRYWIPDRIKHKVSVLAANGVIYLRALEFFPKTRVRVQGLNDQQIYLLDLTVDDNANVSNKLIVMTPDSTTNHAKSSIPKTPREDWRVRLTRYAAKQLYAPERLLVGDQYIQRIPLSVSTPIPLVRGGSVEALPIAAWQGGGLTITAVKLRNQRHQSLQLMFRESNNSNSLNFGQLIRGNWLTATLQHHSLGAKGQPDDTTTLYLISKRSFVESLGSISTPNNHNKEANDG